MKAQSSQTHCRTVRIEDEKLQELISRLDASLGPEVSGREDERYNYNIKACMVELQQPGDGVPKLFASPTRNLSRSGMSIFHGGYVHTGSTVKAKLITTHGTWTDVSGEVVRCNYVDGNIHEVGIRFYETIETADFCPGSIKCRILLVEDDESIAKLARFHLEQLNGEVTHSLDGEIAVDLASKENFDLIIMDMLLPGIDGFEATKRIVEAGFKGKIAAATSLTDPEDREKCLHAGCDLYISKPFSRKDLEDLIESMRVEPLISDFHDDENMAELINDFVKELPGRVRELEEALMKENLDILLNASRKLKGEGGGFGFDPISDCATDLETGLLKKKDLAELQKLTKDLIRLCLLARASNKKINN